MAFDDQTRPFTDEELTGLGGWLIYIGCCLCLNAVLLCHETLVAPNKFALALAGIPLTVCAAAVDAFFAKRRYFCGLALTLLALSIAKPLLFVILVPAPITIWALFVSAAAAAIWTPYFVYSRRVKLTFVRGGVPIDGEIAPALFR